MSQVEQIAEFLRDKLHMNLDGLDISLLNWPLFESDQPRSERVYVKFMSDEGALDAELGDRLARAAEERDVTFERNRARDGYIYPDGWHELKRFWDGEDGGA